MSEVHVFTSVFLIGVAFLVRWKPNLIAGYKFLPEDIKKKYPINILFLGLIAIAILNFVVYFLLLNTSLHRFSDWSFLFVIPIGIVIINWWIHSKIK